MAVESENIDIIKLLLASKKLDVNVPYILNIFFFIKFKTIYFNVVKKHIFR